MLSRLHFGSVLLCFVAVSLASAIIALAWRITRERKKRRTSWKKGRFSKDVFSSSIIHLSGLATIQANENEVVVLCVVRDGEFYLRSFLEHYLNMGVKQIVFLDNGSTDRTLEILKKHRNVSVFQTLLEFKNYELIAKQQLIELFGKGNWVLLVDVDELFEFPGYPNRSINALVSYLQRYGYTALVAQVLDMFSDIPFSQSKVSVDDNLKEKYQYYDLTEVRGCNCRGNCLILNDQNRYSNPRITHLTGGIRRTHFGVDLWLTKYPLVFPEGKTSLPHPHYAMGCHVADVSGLLLHYKFLGNAPDVAKRAFLDGRYNPLFPEYRKYQKVLTSHPRLTFHTAKAIEYAGCEALVSAGFLSISDTYQRWLGE